MSNLEHRISQLEQLIGYTFKNNQLISIAITHPGVAQKHQILPLEFERLEFLGDRVLALSLAEFLYRYFPNDTDGALAVRMASLASTDFLIALAKKTKMIDYFCMPSDFFLLNNKNSSAIADMMEAVFGSIFVDSNFEIVQQIIIKLFRNDIDMVIYGTKDSKTKLQEILQASSRQLPVYKMIQMTGCGHNPVFEIEVSSEDGQSATGYGTSKKNAEHNAAAKLISILESRNKKGTEK